MGVRSGAKGLMRWLRWQEGCKLMMQPLLDGDRHIEVYDSFGSSSSVAKRPFVHCKLQHKAKPLCNAARCGQYFSRTFRCRLSKISLTAASMLWRNKSLALRRQLGGSHRSFGVAESAQRWRVNQHVRYRTSHAAGTSVPRTAPGRRLSDSTGECWG